MASQNSGVLAWLKAGSPQPMYGSFRPNNAPPPYGPSHGHTVHTDRFAAPGPTSSQLLGLPPKPVKRTPLVTFLIIAFFLVLNGVLIFYRSDALAAYRGHKSVSRRASEEVSALKAERAKWEREQENMKHDREMWGKEPEERPPLRAHWTSVQSVDGCRAYGKREYRGMLLNVPKNWGVLDACMNTPVTIKVPWKPDVEIPQPNRCEVVGGRVYGYWMVDRYQDDCKTELKDIHDTGCTNYRSGLTRIEAQVTGIDDKMQDWRSMCESTPFTWGGIEYTSPTHCEERHNTKVATWDVPAESCR